MKPADISLLNSVSTPTVAPDGSRAVVAVTRPDLDADSYVGQLWSVPLTNGSPSRITRGFRDSEPQFSPDGSLLAFLRAGHKDAPQLFVMSAEGGEPVKVTDQKLGVSVFRWAPDGSRIAFLSRVAEDGRYGTVDDLGAAAEPPRRFTTLKYRSNGLGYVTDRRSQVFIVSVPDVAGEPAYPKAPSASDPKPAPAPTVPQPVQLTAVDAEHGGLSFAPDGRLLVVSARHDSRDDDLVSDVFELDPNTPDAEATRITGGQLAVFDTHVSAEGTVYVTGYEVGDGNDFVARNAGLYRLDGSECVPLTDAETIDLNEMGSRLSSFADGSVLVQNRVRGRIELLRVSPDGAVESIWDDDVTVTGQAIVGATVVATFASPTTTGDVAVIRDGAITTLTDFSSAIVAAGIIEPIEFTVTARDGYDVHGWVVLPEGEGPHPVLLNIHGGPFAAYSVALFDEAQVYADAGYAVVMCNPRGSAGYGQAHGRVIRQAMGTVDMTDMLDFLDGAVAAHPSLGADRVGIMGGSYGGYLTAWIIAHDHRFAAAIVERGFLDPEGFVGTSDIGSFFGDEYVGVDPELMRSQSPQAVVGSVTTPTLVLHSEEDYRCPLPQAERYFAALKRQGTEAELLVFPGENHELSRSGRPRHRVQRFEAILEWWDRYLPVSP